MILAKTAVLLRNRQRKETVLAEDFEVAIRVEKLIIGALRVGAHLVLTEIDQLRTKFNLLFSQDPVRIPVVAEPPEFLIAPHLLGHLIPPL
ncbi:unannotated protein [freshwater metagenome]|uniref:Unannotated protein n=1 Tax=freshwater metagenome TaxID=449393 RepID=A0A6J5ZWC8_9ZZZZ